MGEIADMMLDGTLCEGCGVYLGSDMGFPMRCPDCEPAQHPPSPNPRKMNCPDCGKRIKRAGLADHMRDVHEQEQ